MSALYARALIEATDRLIIGSEPFYQSLKWGPGMRSNAVLFRAVKAGLAIPPWRLSPATSHFLPLPLCHCCSAAAAAAARPNATMSTVPAQALPPPESPMEEKDNLKITGAETMLEYADIQGESGDVVHTVDGVSWTQEEERAIVKRYDWNIVTIVFTLFMQVLFQSAFFAFVLILLASYRAGFRSSTVPVRCYSCPSEGSPCTDSRHFNRHRQFVALAKVASIPLSSTHRSPHTQMRTRPECPSISA